MIFQNKNIAYSVRVSRRAKRMRIAIYCDSAVVVTLPLGFSADSAEEFIKSKFSWVTKTLERFKPYRHFAPYRSGRRDYKKFKNQAKQLALEKIEQWNKQYNFVFNKINIKNQKSRWGSCSKKGNLNFNYKIVDLPHRLVDYLVVHELCHLKEFNHNRSFWELVSQTMPDYKVLRSELRHVNNPIP